MILFDGSHVPHARALLARLVGMGLATERDEYVLLDVDALARAMEPFGLVFVGPLRDLRADCGTRYALRPERVPDVLRGMGALCFAGDNLEPWIRSFQALQGAFTDMETLDFLASVPASDDDAEMPASLRLAHADAGPREPRGEQAWALRFARAYAARHADDQLLGTLSNAADTALMMDML